jgi:murein peptide amidase A
MNTVVLERPLNARPAAPPAAPTGFLSPFDEIAAQSDYLIAKPLVEFAHAGERHQIPRYVFLGPRGGGDTIRLGIFATIHGDEPEGALGLVRFLHALEKNPGLARG